MPSTTPVLIVGAGPFGLSLAAYLDHLGISYRMHGVPMAFWRDHMPQGMLLRSACDWHLDPIGAATIEAYLETIGLTPVDVEPLSLGFYLQYAAWFQEQKALTADPRLVGRLDREEDGSFVALLDDGDTVTADAVVLAIGFRHFAHVPDEVRDLFPTGRYSHTVDLVDLDTQRGKRCLILGGRQSAFEWAALLHEAGAASVNVCHRHPSPGYEEADWDWVPPLVDGMIGNPAWYRKLPAIEQEAISRRMWGEGRLKVEPWLQSRVEVDTVRIHPERTISACRELSDGALEVMLDDGESLTVDHVILATGYAPDVRRVPMLAAGNLPDQIEMRANGVPMLDPGFQTSVPGLYMTSMLAVADFGPFFAFTVSVRTSAHVIGNHLRGTLV